MGFQSWVPLDQIMDATVGADLHKWLRHLDVGFYKNFGHCNGVADLAELSDNDAIVHFVKRGYLEGRAYNRALLAFIDPKFYRERYPELGLRSDGDAIRHWMYQGYYEQKVPNVVTEQMLNATIHLFQMGKVGSKSIQESLQRAGYKNLIPHLHWADELVFSYPDCFYDYEQVIRFNPGRDLLFISGVRDPIERVISGMFQAAGDPKSSLTFDRLVQLIKGPWTDVKPRLGSSLARVLGWFDHCYFSGLDVYAYPFDVGKGYTVIEKNNVTIFLYRLDALDQCWPVLSDIVGLRLERVEMNQSGKKEYANLLRRFLVRREVRREFSGVVEASRYWRHFFGGHFGR